MLTVLLIIDTVNKTWLTKGTSYMSKTFVLTPEAKKDVLRFIAVLMGVILVFGGLIVFAVKVVAPHSQSSAMKFQRESVQLVNDTYGVEVVSYSVHGLDWVTNPNTVTIKKDGKLLTCKLPDRPAIENKTPLRGCEPSVP